MSQADHVQSSQTGNAWFRFWFQPSRAGGLDRVRQGLAVIVAVYFASAWGDLSLWYSYGGPASSTNLSGFLRDAGFAEEARWLISPLFLWDSLFQGTLWAEATWVYQLYVLIGIALAGWVALVIPSSQVPTEKLPRGRVLRLMNSVAPLLLWIWFVGWANRISILSSIAEPILSVSLAAIAIAPVAPLDASKRFIALHWRNTLSRRLLSCQVTLIAVMTTATMLAGRCWWDGTGAYVLNAPAEDRLISVRGTWFEVPWVYESTTMFLVIALPLGIFLAWQRAPTQWNTARQWGVALVWVWCLIVALLSQHLIYAATIAVICMAIISDTGAAQTAPASDSTS